jgi:hypothetical protein
MDTATGILVLILIPIPTVERWLPLPLSPSVSAVAGGAVIGEVGAAAGTVTGDTSCALPCRDSLA